jgi:hypothetical protein
VHDDAPIYEIAAAEIAGGKPERGILAKAFSAALGDEPKTRALYIQYRVEHLKAEIARRAAEDARRRAGGRKGRLAELRQRFEYVLRTTIPESDSPSSAYAGNPNSIAAPERLSDVSEALGLLEFRLIDAVKAGLVDGVVDQDGEWWVSAKNG